VRIKDLRADNKVEGDLGVDFPTETLSVKASIEAGFAAAGSGGGGGGGGGPTAAE
jgi:hypothetical protein